MNKWNDVFAENFDSDGEYVDAAFMLIILFNFGQWLDKENLTVDGTEDHREWQR